MDLLNFISEVLANPLLTDDKDSKKRRPKIYILFFILLIPSFLWFLVELKAVFDLTAPILFLVIFISTGLLLSVGTLILIYKLGLIEELSTKDVFTIVIPVTLLTVSIASFANRTFEIMFQG